MSKLLLWIKTGFKMPQYSPPVFAGCVGMQRFSSFINAITLKHNLRKRLSSTLNGMQLVNWDSFAICVF